MENAGGGEHWSSLLLGFVLRCRCDTGWCVALGTEVKSDTFLSRLQELSHGSTEEVSGMGRVPLSDFKN